MAGDIRSDAGVVLVAVAEHGSNSHDGRSGEVEVHSRVGGRVVVHNPCNHGNVEVDGDSHYGCIHHSSEELVSSVAFLQETNSVNTNCITNIPHTS